MALTSFMKQSTLPLSPVLRVPESPGVRCWFIPSKLWLRGPLPVPPLWEMHTPWSIPPVLIPNITSNPTLPYETYGWSHLHTLTCASPVAWKENPSLPICKSLTPFKTEVRLMLPMNYLGEARHFFVSMIDWILCCLHNIDSLESWQVCTLVSPKDHPDANRRHILT